MPIWKGLIKLTHCSQIANRVTLTKLDSQPFRKIRKSTASALSMFAHSFVDLPPDFSVHTDLDEFVFFAVCSEQCLDGGFLNEGVLGIS